MTRIRAIFAAAAVAFVGGGLTLSQALDQEGSKVGMTCEDWKGDFRKLARQPGEQWFVAVRAFPPPAFVGENGGFLIGDCAGGSCVASPELADCDASTEYTYRLFAQVNGWRFAEVSGPIDFARSWWELADSDPVNYRFAKSWKDLLSGCVAAFGAADCVSLLDGIECWERISDGELCRYGKLAGRKTTCTTNLTDWRPYPCEQGTRDLKWLQEIHTRTFPTKEEIGSN